MNKILVLSIAVSLGGCSASSLIGEAKTGGAVYDYQHTTADGSSCSINGTSAKEVPGVEIEISKDCDLTVKANSSSPVGDGLSAIRTFAEKMPDLSVVPVP